MSTVATPARPRDKAAPARAILSWVLPAATLALLVVAWEVATRAFGWPVWLVPAPGDVWSALVDNRSLLPEHFRVTLVETLGGFALAIAVGIALAVAIAYSRLLERTIYPGTPDWDESVGKALRLLKARLSTVEWTRASLNDVIKDVVKTSGLKMPQLAMPLRRLVTGRTQTPSIDAVLELLGRETVLHRLTRHLDED
jgi:hypothetical protein